MTRLIKLFIIIGFAVWAGINIAKDPGYMLLAYKHWTLETPLWFGIILWLIFAGFIILISNIWRDVGSIAARWHAWRSKRKLTRSNNLTARSLLECIEGYFDSAEKNILKALPHADIPLIDYLIAAYCANAQGKAELRDHYFLQAKNVMPEAEVAIQLLKIEWLIAADQLTQARTEVELLLNEDPHQNRALILAKNCYQKLGAWDSLLKISQTLRKRKIIKQEEYESLQSKAYAAKLRQALVTQDSNTLSAAWLTIPHQMQKLPELILVYAQALITLHQGNAAADLLQDCLKKYWDDTLVYQYGLAITANPEQQLNHAEKWLPDHEDDAVLLLTLGRLCARANLFAKARSYFEASVNLCPKPETYLALAELNLAHHDQAAAMEYYAKGLQCAVAR